MSNLKYDFDKSFQEILYRIDNWTSKGSGQVIEYVDAKYVNISIYNALSGRKNIGLLLKLKQLNEGSV